MPADLLCHSTTETPANVNAFKDVNVNRLIHFILGTIILLAAVSVPSPKIALPTDIGMSQLVHANAKKLSVFLVTTKTKRLANALKNAFKSKLVPKESSGTQAHAAVYVPYFLLHACLPQYGMKTTAHAKRYAQHQSLHVHLPQDGTKTHVHANIASRPIYIQLHDHLLHPYLELLLY